MRSKAGKFAAGILCALLLSSVTGCVNQHPAAEDTDGSSGQSEETAAEELRIAATSVAVMQICEKLDLDLAGVPHSDLTDIPERYETAESIGSPMSPDLEILSQLDPDWVLSPASLINDLQPEYEEAGLRYAFLNLKSVPGMFKSIQELGELFGRTDEAQKLVGEFESYYADYQESHEDDTPPTVLILMGLPGSYVVATENSYVGSLVEMAGGINVYGGTEDEFLNVNTEDMLQKDPDMILRTAHAMPESVMQMFAEEFDTNDIWKHFRAVQCGQVYDLSNEEFGMSANFNYQNALKTLDEILYADGLNLSGGE